MPSAIFEPYKKSSHAANIFRVGGLRAKQPEDILTTSFSKSTNYLLIISFSPQKAARKVIENIFLRECPPAPNDKLGALARYSEKRR